jgi:ComEC/Rec2-related protein
LIIQSRLEKITSDDFLGDLRREGINYRLVLNEKNHTVVGKVSVPLRTKVRNWIIHTNNHLYGEKTGGIVNALYLGDSFFTDRKTIYDFTRAGLLHILAASGTHVALVAAIPLMLLSFLHINKKTSLGIASLIIAGYLHITCAPVSLVRACVMFWFLAIFQIFSKEKNPLNALYLSGSVILMIYPYDLFSLGFQLSFGATLGLILFYKRFMNIIPKIPFTIRESLSLTFSAQILVLPIIALTLGQINFTGIISNIIIVPGISCAMVSSFLPLAVFPLNEHIAETLAVPIHLFYDLNLSATEFFAHLDGHFILSSFSPLLLIPWLVFCFSPLIHLKINLIGSVLCFAALASVFFPLKTGKCRYASPVPLAVQGHSIIFTDSGATIVGGLNPEDIPAVETALDRQGYFIPEIILTDISDESLRGTERFMKKRPVSRIAMSRAFVINGNLRRFVETVECDGIPFAFLPEKIILTELASSAGITQ